MNTWTRRLLGGLSLLALGFVGCAQERPPINRVQPNALEKAFFVGDLADQSDDPVFYSKAFVIDQSVGQNGISVGLYSGKDRIKWEISEDALIARKAYQIVIDQDGHAVPDKTNGTVVAKYRIISHFDIKRSYNPQTGEELNIVEENTSDRPWNERKYMRVDWSTNQVNDPMWGEMFFGKIFGDMSVEPLTYTITDPKNEDAPYFDAADGYFDITNKYYIAPENTYIWGMQIPTCALVGIYTGTTSADCNAQEATVRHSFWRVDKADTDFEPMENTLRKMDVIANFGGAGDSFQPSFAGGTTQCYDPQYQYPESCFHQYLNKTNFWGKSHVKDTSGQWVSCDSDADANDDGTADACEKVTGMPRPEGGVYSKGSQCDTFEMKKHPGNPDVHGRCTIPLRDRPIVSRGYWLNKETPAELLDPVDGAGNPTGMGAMEEVIYTWNQAMMVALATAREVECRRTGDGSREACHDKYFEPGMQMLKFGGWGIPIPRPQPGDAAAAMISCHAPVRVYDNHDVCGKTGEVARNGDQRKNFIYYWPYDSDAHYGGVAGLNPDPETGESIGTTATTMGRSATFAAARYRDFIQYAMGDITLDEYTTGVPQFIYNKIQQNGYSPESPAGKLAAGESLDSIPVPQGEKSKPAGNTMTTKPSFEASSLRDAIKAQLDRTYDPVMQGMAQPLWESLAAKLRGTEWEAQLVDPGWMMQTTGFNPKDPVTNSALEAASPFRNLDNGRLELWRAQIGARLANRGICFVDDVPRLGSINFAGIARWYMDKFAAMGLDSDVAKDGTGMWQPGPRDAALVKQRGEFIYHDLFKGMAKGIAIHEMGHCLGMRHNFASSYDAPNYMPQYWQLRTNEGQVTEPCVKTTKPGDPDVCMGPRFNDPQTEDELGLTQGQGRPSVAYFGNTSVMEYEQDYLSPGFGKYDLFYTKAVYGGVLETYDDSSVPLADQAQFDINLALQRADINIIGTTGGSVTIAHYTKLANAMKVFDPTRDCRDATPEELAQGEWRIVHGKLCGQGPRDHYRWKDFLDDDQGSTFTACNQDSDCPLVDSGEKCVSPGNGGEKVCKFSPLWDLAYAAWHVRPAAAGGVMPHRWNYRYGETYGHGYLHTNYSDSGADAYELTMGNSQMFDLTYPQTYFRRGNKEYFYNSLPATLANRFLERARAYHWILEDSPSQSYLGPEYDMARRETFHFLTRVAMTPEPGGMVAMNMPNGGVYYDVPPSSITAPSQFQLALIDGRYVADEFDDFKGGQWDYLSWIKHAGFNAERGLAIRALLDGRPTLYTISRETWLDGRNVMKNFRTDAADAVDRFVGGLLSEDWETVGMYTLPSEEVPDASGVPFRSTHMLDLMAASPAKPAGAATVFPNIGYKNQLALIQFAHLYGRMNSDMTLLNKMRIYVEGVDMVGTAFPETELVKFTDDVSNGSGMTYVARLFGPDKINGKTVDRGIASRMIQHANDLKNTGDLTELRKYVGLLDATRQISQLFWFKGPVDGLQPEW